LNRYPKGAQISFNLLTEGGGMANSMDLREWAMARLAAGESAREVAIAWKIAVASVIKWVGRARQFGRVAPGGMGGHRPFAIRGERRLFVLRQIEMMPHDAAGAVRGLGGARSHGAI
jgi:hypothetical protein